MKMNVKPIPTLSERTNEIRNLTAEIVNKEILPNENKLWAWRTNGRLSDSDRREARDLRENIKANVKKAGLWAPHLPPEYGGCGLSFLEHAYMNEVLAYASGAAALFGVVAPNSGNQKILLKYGTEEQKKKWLVPLTEGKTFFYDQIRMFFDRIPRDQWTLIDERPVIWLYFSLFASAFDQPTFDHIYDSFERDYGVRPYIVRELSWDFAVRNEGGRIIDEDSPIATEANYKWGAAFDGYSTLGSVAAAGPGFDEREIPGRGEAYRPRDEGAWYFQNFGKAIDSGKRMVVIETWNEIHEASGIGETVEFGRTYIELTRALTDEYRSQLNASP